MNPRGEMHSWCSIHLSETQINTIATKKNFHDEDDVPFHVLNFANNDFNARGNKTFLEHVVLHGSHDRISETNTKQVTGV
jgi:hypothetical protein